MKEYAWYLIRQSGIALTVLILLVGACHAGSSADFEQGLQLYNQRQYRNAVKLFEGVASTDAALATKARYQIGMCYYMQQLLDSAIPAFIEAVKSAKLEDGELVAEAKLKLAQCYVDAKDMDKAWPVIEELSLTSPVDPSRLLFQYYREKQDYERGAATLIYGLVRMSGVDHVGSTGLPSWLVDVHNPGPFSAVVDTFRDRLLSGAEFAVDSPIKMDLQGALEMCGRGDAAAVMARRMVAESVALEDRTQKVFNLAGVCYRTGRYGEAVEVLEDLLKSSATLSDSDQASARYSLGNSYWKLGDVTSAKRCMQEIVDLYPGSERARWASAHLASWAKAASGKQ